MYDDKLMDCLTHLNSAERLMDAAGDLASLARIALVIDILRREHGLPDRTIAALVFPS